MDYAGDMSSTNNSLACHGESLQVVIDKAHCSIRIHQLGDENPINSTSRLVVGSYCWHQCIDRSNQPSIRQTSSTKPSHFRAICAIGDTVIGDLYDGWDSRSCSRGRACQAYWAIQCCL